jgi:putative selenate reductase FAD-binding subunit
LSHKKLQKLKPAGLKGFCETKDHKMTSKWGFETTSSNSVKGEDSMIQDFFKPQSIAEAIALKEKFKDEAVYIAGGTGVNCMDSKSEIEKVISIEQLQLNKISKTKRELSIGAGVTIQELIDSPKVPEQLTIAARHFVNRNIRNIATIGGNIAFNKSTSNLIPILIVLDAKLKIGGSKTPVPLDDYITQEMTHLIERITISSKDLNKKYHIRKFSRTANDITIIVAAVAFNIHNETLANVRVAVGGVSKHVVRLIQLENKLEGSTLLSATEIENRVQDIVSPVKDIRGGVEFKKYMAGILVSDCVHHAYHGRAGNSKP